MHIHPNGKAGGKGHARVQREDEARKLYSRTPKTILVSLRLRFTRISYNQPDRTQKASSAPVGHQRSGEGAISLLQL